MRASAFYRFVEKTDQSVGKSPEDRFDIALYGLAAEIGSVVSALKKRLLVEEGAVEWNTSNDEIVEELGDVLWYCFALSRIKNDRRFNIFAYDIRNLRREISADDDRAKRIGDVIDSSKRKTFLKESETLLKWPGRISLDDYQRVAYLTARTEPQTLAVVCLAVLWQLSAQLFRSKLPAIELNLNRTLPHKPINKILGEILWHVAALASIYGLKLSQIAEANINKVSFRRERGRPTPLHDRQFRSQERLPRRFSVAFVSVEQGRLRMYLDGQRLGDDLTDNAYDDDGYRFHDIMHLANAAKLGWSPVLRGLMGRKRRSVKKIDEVEDGARAKIVEEAVIKVIHTEGERVAGLRNPAANGEPTPLFSKPDEITFRFLQLIRKLVEGLEVWDNHYWEWEDAIIAGHDIFYQLRREQQGTVEIDVDARSITFRPEVCVPLIGKVASVGLSFLDISDSCSDPRLKELMTDLRGAQADTNAVRLAVQTLAVLDALGISDPTSTDLAELKLTELDGERISVKASGSAQQAMWDRKIVAFRTTIRPDNRGGYYCTATALTD